MNKQKKIACLDKAMTRSERDNGDTFYHFTDDAPKELVDLFFENYEVRGVDYETFSDACDIMSDILNSDDVDYEGIDARIHEQSEGTASVYTATQLSYIDIWNQDEISSIVREFEMDIAVCAAIWYERQVQEMCQLLLEWINHQDND